MFWKYQKHPVHVNVLIWMRQHGDTRGADGVNGDAHLGVAALSNDRFKNITDIQKTLVVIVVTYMILNIAIIVISVTIITSVDVNHIIYWLQTLYNFNMFVKFSTSAVGTFAQ